MNMQPIAPASIFRRVGGLIFDYLFILLCLSLGAQILGPLGVISLGLLQGPLVVTGLLLVILYEPILVSRYGQTLGHRVVGIQVVATDGSGHITFIQALVRAATKYFLGWISFITLIVKDQTIHDMFSQSYVVEKGES